MRKSPHNPVRAIHLGRRRMVEFEAAVRIVGARVRAGDVNVAGTPVSVFKTHYATILKRINAGAIEVVTQRGQPFVILGLDQVIALVKKQSTTRRVREVFAEFPTVPASATPPRYTSINTKSSYRVR